jgi:hypothetical protein
MGLARLAAAALGATTTIANGASAELETPSVTDMMICVYLPTLAAVGLPDSIPVVESNFDHSGWFSIVKLSAAPGAAVTVGRNR